MPAQIGSDVVRYLQAMIPVWFHIDTTLRPGQRIPAAGKISRRAAAEVIGTSTTELNDLLVRRMSAGQKIENRIAELRFGGKVDRLRAAAKKWAIENPEGAVDAAARRGLSGREAKPEATTTPASPPPPRAKPPRSSRH